MLVFAGAILGEATPKTEQALVTFWAKNLV